MRRSDDAAADAGDHDPEETRRACRVPGAGRRKIQMMLALTARLS